MVRENVSPRSPRVRAAKMDEFINVARCDMALRADNPVAAPLLDRYKTLMRASRACCTDGMTNALRDAGASDGLIYKFLSDDANFYNIGARCLMTTDAELDTKYPNTATAAVAGWRSWSATITFTVPGPFHLLMTLAAPTPSTSLAYRW